MSARATSRLAWSLCALILLLLASSVLLIVLGWSTPLPGGWTPWWNQAIALVGVIGAPILGGLIVSRRPENPYGWLWLGFGFGQALLGFAECYAAYALVAEPGSLPIPRVVGTLVAAVGWWVTIALVPLLLLLFPTGRPPSRHWRIVVWIVFVAGALGLFPGTLVPESAFAPVEKPLGIGGVVGEAIGVLDIVVVFVIFGCTLLSVLSLVFRFRRASGIERQQIKWFAYAAVLLGGGFVFSGVLGLDLPGVWDAVFETAIFAGLYVAVGVAILRFRLYEIDRIINRTLVYGSLTLMLVLIYLGGVAAAQTAFRSLTGQAQQPQLVVVASTLAIAALFNPLRRRLQAFVDRRFYRRKYDARKTLEGFGARLRDETDLDELSGDLVSVVRDTVQPAHVSVWLRPTGWRDGRATE
jgi:hypothetical protein